MSIKWRTPPSEHKPITVTRPDGSTFETTTETTFAPVPVPPKDWDLIGVRVAVGMVLMLTLVAVAGSTWSIGSLLHGGLGYLAAGVFDLSWGTCLVLEWLGRYDKADVPQTRRRIRRPSADFTEGLGWFLLAITMGAIFWHAWPDVRYAVVGAVVSGVAKILWLGIMKHIQIKLTQTDRDDLRDRRSKAAVGLAFATVDRQVMRANAHTAAVRLSLEAGRPETLRLVAEGTNPAELERAGRQLIEQSERVPEPIAVKEADNGQTAQLARKVDLLARTIEQIASTGDRDRDHGEHVREHGAITASTIANTGEHDALTRANTVREQIANTDHAREHVREHASIADVVREQIANTASNSEAIANVLAIIPSANAASVGAAVRRERRKAGPYL